MRPLTAPSRSAASRRGTFVFAIALVAALVLPAESAPAPQSNKLVTHVHGNNVEGANGNLNTTYSVSGSGRYIAFEYVGGTDDLVADYTDRTGGGNNIFLYDKKTQTNTLVTKSINGPTAGDSADGNSQNPVLSADGRFVAYTSSATDLITGFDDASENFGSVYVYEIATQTNRLVTHVPGDDNKEADLSAIGPVINADGSRVAYRSLATDLVTGFLPLNETNDEADVYLWDRSTNTNRLVSHAFDNHLQGESDSRKYYLEDPLSISADGRYLAYGSIAGNLVNGFIDNNNGGAEPGQDLYLYNADNDTNTLITHRFDGVAVGADGNNSGPRLSANGARVVFDTTSSDLINGFVDNNTTGNDVFVWNRSTNKPRLVTFSAAGGPKQGAAPSGGFNGSVPWISANGKAIAYESDANDLIKGFQDGFNGQDDIWLWTEKKIDGKPVYRNSLVSRDVRFGAKRSQFQIPTLWGFSAGGKHVLYQTGDQWAIKNFTNANGGKGDLYIYDATTQKAILVSRTPSSAVFSSNGNSSARATHTPISADGRTVAYISDATNLVTGFEDGNGVQSDIYRFGP